LPQLFLRRQFLIPFLITFIIFGFLLNFFAAGTANWQIFLLSNLRGKMVLFINIILVVFGIGRSLPDFLFLTIITLIQSVLVGLLFFILSFRKQNLADNLQSTGIIASFFLLSSGCPTCGTALLTPVFLSILGSSGLALAGTISVVLNCLSIILALFVFRKIGYEAYIILADQKYRAKQSIQDSLKEK